MNIVIIVAKNLLEYFNSLNAYDMIFMGANIVLMLLIATFIYVLKIKDNSVVKEEVLTDTKDSDISLEALTTKLQNNPLVREDLTPFESEEETKAIISYDELIKTQSIPVLKYKNEESTNKSFESLMNSMKKDDERRVFAENVFSVTEALNSDSLLTMIGSE